VGTGIPIFRRSAVQDPSGRLPTPEVAANTLPRNVVKEEAILRVAQFQTNEILKLKNKELIFFESRRIFACTLKAQ
jgi:hypothetical protein